MDRGGRRGRLIPSGTIYNQTGLRRGREQGASLPDRSLDTGATARIQEVA
jgi:hypothetical protein